MKKIHVSNVIVDHIGKIQKDEKKEAQIRILAETLGEQVGQIVVDFLAVVFSLASQSNICSGGNNNETTVEGYSLLTAKDVAERLKISKANVYKLIQSGTIPSVRINRTVRVKTDDLENFIADHSYLHRV